MALTGTELESRLNYARRMRDSATNVYERQSWSDAVKGWEEVIEARRSRP